MDFIKNNKLKYYTKEILKIFSFITIAVEIISILVFTKYRTAYAVTLSNQEIGYIENENEFKQTIDSEILNIDTLNVDNISFGDDINYKLILLNKNEQTNENDILNKLKNDLIITYKYYSIAINNENVTSLSTLEEAAKLLEELQNSDVNTTDLNISIIENYTLNKDEVNPETYEIAKDILNKKVIIKEKEVKEEKRINNLPDINGIKLAVVPVNGNISSRYGAISSRRSGAHTGLDIASPIGTDIKTAASGTIISAQYEGSYGNIVKVDHGNGVETWYAHCSRFYVKAGDTVEAGDVIAAVGSTGNSTGPHLHFEIRVDGNTLNPENYIFSE